MKIPAPLKVYPPLEEKINVYSHLLGLFFSIIALILLVIKSVTHGNVWHIVSFSIFGASLIILYAASSLYHSSKDLQIRRRLKVFDHAAIYVLIAGSYTPFVLVTLKGQVGWILFGVTWSMAIIGIILKLFFTGKYNLISTLMYILMGWLIIFAVKPLITGLSPEGLIWLVAGGVSYTSGAFFYGIKRIPFNHALFHLFVLGGSFCHFITVYFFVIS